MIRTIAAALALTLLSGCTTTGASQEAEPFLLSRTLQAQGYAAIPLAKLATGHEPLSSR